MTGPGPEGGAVSRQAGEELAGVWSLVSFDTVREDGSVLPGPLGEKPTGLLFYSADGHVAVHMMPADGPPAYLSYAGTWRREADRIVHHLTVAAERDWLGTDQSRHLRLDGDLLTLTGTSLSTTDLRVLVWRRLGPTGP